MTKTRPEEIVDALPKELAADFRRASPTILLAVIVGAAAELTVRASK